MGSTQQWDNERRKLKKYFEETLGITVCELRLPGCSYNNYLSFAHSKKRREIHGEEIREVVLACINCHTVIERMSHDEMYEIVRLIIENR